MSTPSNNSTSIPTNLLSNNRAWADRLRTEDPGFFLRLSHQQTPQYFWIGCSDSRVPATQITGLLPGEMFVHRNVANVVPPADLNCLSALQFAVDVLKVRHVIVCGHYGCSGIRAAMEGHRLGLVDDWLRNVADVRQKHAVHLAGLENKERQLDRLCELNVMEQVAHVANAASVQDAWARGQALVVHGWIYAVDDGLLRDLGLSVDGPAGLAIERANPAASQGAPLAGAGMTSEVAKGEVAL